MKTYLEKSSDFLLLSVQISLSFVHQFCNKIIELPHDKTNKMICAPSEDSDQPGHSPSLIRVFAVCSVGSWGPNVSSCGQRRLWSDWADAQADRSVHWAQRSFCWFCHEAAHMYFTSTPEPLYNTVYYKTISDLSWLSVGLQIRIWKSFPI